MLLLSSSLRVSRLVISMGHKEWRVASLMFSKRYFGSEEIRRGVKYIMKKKRTGENWDEPAKSEGNNGYKSNCLGEDKIFSSAPPPIFSPQSDSCLTESDKAERSWWRQAPQYVEFCLPDSRRKKLLLPRPSHLPDQANGSQGRPGEMRDSVSTICKIYGSESLFAKSLETVFISVSKNPATGPYTGPSSYPQTLFPWE
jgi:hypothetical protein